MSRVIDVVRGSSNLSRTPRIYKNLIKPDFTTWSDVTSGTGSAPIISGTNNDTFLSDKGVGTGRSMLGSSFEFIAGKTYAFGCTVSGRTGGSTLLKKDIITFASTSAGTNELIVPDGTTGSRFCVRFTSDTSGSAIIRLGIGSSDNESSAVTSEIISKPFIYEIDTITSPIPDYLDPTDAIGVYNYEAVNTVAGDGTVTEVSTTPTLFPQTTSNKVGLFLGDSYSTDVTEWPQKLVELDGNMVLIGDGNAGQTSQFQLTHIDDVLSLDGYTLDGDIAPTFVILQGSVNDPNAGLTAQDTVTAMTVLINKVKAAGLTPIVTNIAPAKQSSSFTQTKVDQLTETNLALETMATDLRVALVDIFTPLVSEDNETMQTAYYLVGDEIHPSPAGSEVIARAIHSVIDVAVDLESVSSVVSGSGVTAEYANSTNLPTGRDFGTKRYQDDGDIIPNYIHTDFPNR